jgi:hypothetical protein
MSNFPDRASRGLGSFAPALLLSTACAIALPVVAAPGPATFDEHVGIGGFTATGGDLALAETVDLTVRSEDWADRGGGTGRAIAGNVVPVSAAVELHLTGGTNISGIGGSAVVLTRYFFEIVALDEGVPDWVDVRIEGFGSVTVATNWAGGPGGVTFARLTTPLGQLDVDNNDPSLGWLTGHWEDHASFEGLLQIGRTYYLNLYVHTHGQGLGPGYDPSYRFDGEAFLDPSVTVLAPWTGSTKIVYGPGVVVVPEPATALLWASGLVVLAALAGRRQRPGTRTPVPAHALAVAA